jgi:hypothetical protein
VPAHLEPASTFTVMLREFLSPEILSPEILAPEVYSESMDFEKQKVPINFEMIRRSSSIESDGAKTSPTKKHIFIYEQ